MYHQLCNASNPPRKGLERAHRPETSERPDAAVRRPASDPRGHEPAGVRHAAGARVEGAVSRADDRDGRSHRADARSAAAVHGRHGGGHALGARAQLPRGRHAAVRPQQRLAGHRPRHRAGAGTDAAGDDDRLRRQPHVDARRVWRGRVRHRHVAGARRARVAVPGAGAAQGAAHRRVAARSRRASTRRTSSSRSSAASASTAASATPTSTPATRSSGCRWTSG